MVRIVVVVVCLLCIWKPLSEPTARQLARGCSTVVVGEKGAGWGSSPIASLDVQPPAHRFSCRKVFFLARTRHRRSYCWAFCHTQQAQERAIPPKMRYEHGKSSKCVIFCCRSSLVVEYDCDTTLSGLLCVPRARRASCLYRGASACDKTLVPYSRVLSGRGLAR